MTTRIPIIPTIIVAGAIAVMIALGIWQLGRMDEKEALVAKAEQSARMSSEVGYPRTEAELQDRLYRRTTIECPNPTGATSTAGTSERGQNGVAQRVTCTLEDGTQVPVDIGFSRNPQPVEWSGGQVRGTIAPGGRVVSAQPLAGLEPLARPDPRDLPNNHLAYAGQWFFFALTALVIYILALRRRATRARDD
ncbi:SURF1 family cytochrome oxidase biogenesis protein [Qipengyuania sphaerica]|uniref:SURF1 family cytochrome oxidase biogenesis protein n=1 Tax=Qipengyuania sphaerica TaxID=2867243 RepID=UPI001C870B00|nr:SURF1 family cytochrome oxidase biogenesis protein [Qipengyuania sphaerica]MBX7540986.1 SURF1 family protein [Qipengyuania sphaerica]